MQLNIKLDEILHISSLITHATKFHCAHADKVTDRHCPKIGKLCLGHIKHLKMCKTTKTGNLGFLRKQCFHIICWPKYWC